MERSFSDKELELTLPALRRFALRLTRNPDQADDLVHDTVERAIIKSHYFLANSNLRAWMFTICRNIFFNGIRLQKSRGYSVEYSDDMHRFCEASQENGIHFKDMVHHLDTLAPHEKAIIIMVSINGASYREASAQLGIPTGTVRSRLSRARRRLHYMATDGGQENTSPVCA